MEALWLAKVSALFVYLWGGFGRLVEKRIIMTKDQERKVAAKQLLCARYTNQMKDRLRAIDERLVEYYQDMIAHSSAIEHDDYDHYNLYEILGAARFLRMLCDYEFNYRKVRTVIRLG